MVTVVIDTIRFQVAAERLPDWLRDEFAAQLEAAPLHLAGGTVPAQRRTSVTVGNINIRLNAAGLVVVENSLHRFYHGHNGGTFTRAEIAAAIAKLSDALGFDVGPCQLLRVDVGANIALSAPEAVLQALAAISSYKGKPFTKYELGNSITGAKRTLTELEVKAYDKSRELARKRLAILPEPTLRFEVSGRKRAYVSHLGVATVADLTSDAFYKAAGAELTARVQACSFVDGLDWALLTPDEVEAVALLHNPAAWASYKANRANKDRCTRRRKLAEKAIQRAAICDTKRTLLSGLQEAIRLCG